MHSKVVKFDHFKAMVVDHLPCGFYSVSYYLSFHFRLQKYGKYFTYRFSILSAASSRLLVGATLSNGSVSADRWPHP